MAEQTFNQEFDGYWREIHKSGLPSSSGVYCVYECTYNKDKQNISIHKLIYIGESENVNQRVDKHEKLADWMKHVNKGNELCYSSTLVDTYYRNRVEAAFIFHHKPPVNTEYVDNFPFDKTIVKSKGKIALLSDFFVANTTK